MSLKERLRSSQGLARNRILEEFGVKENPFPTAGQTSGHPHYPISQDAQAEERLVSFFRNSRSEVLVVVGTQGVGKTNFLTHLESEVREAVAEMGGTYVVRYMGDPEPSFDATVRTILQELGVDHLKLVSEKIAEDASALESVRSFDLRSALKALSRNTSDAELFGRALEWLLGFRVLKAHREQLGISFRLDTVESRTAALRDYVHLSAELGLLDGIFLLLDEIEKQEGVLGPTAIVRYLSTLRAIIDALPNRLFLVVAITPDAMRRYASALPALRSRLDTQIMLESLKSYDEAQKLAAFYLDKAKELAKHGEYVPPGDKPLVTNAEMLEAFEVAKATSERRADIGVRQREFLNMLHQIAERKIQEL